MPADADHLVDLLDLRLPGPRPIELEAVEPDDQPLVRPPVTAVPDGVRAEPLADDHVGPFDEGLAGGLIVSGQRRPGIDPDLELGQPTQGGQDLVEELQVVAGHPDPQRLGPRADSRRRRERPLEQDPDAGHGGLDAVGHGRRLAGRCGRLLGAGLGRQPGQVLDDRRLGPGEEGIASAQERLVHRRPVEDHRQADRAVLEDLGRELEAGIERGDRASPGRHAPRRRSASPPGGSGRRARSRRGWTSGRSASVVDSRDRRSPRGSCRRSRGTRP